MDEDIPAAKAAGTILGPMQFDGRQEHCKILHRVNDLHFTIGEHPVAVANVLQAHTGGIHDLVFKLEVVAHDQVTVFSKHFDGEWLFCTDYVVFDGIFRHRALQLDVERNSLVQRDDQCGENERSDVGDNDAGFDLMPQAQPVEQIGYSCVNDEKQHVETQKNPKCPFPDGIVGGVPPFQFCINPAHAQPEKAGVYERYRDARYHEAPVHSLVGIAKYQQRHQQAGNWQPGDDEPAVIEPRYFFKARLPFHVERSKSLAVSDGKKLERHDDVASDLPTGKSSGSDAIYCTIAVGKLIFCFNADCRNGR